MKSSGYLVFNYSVLLCPNLCSTNLHNSLHSRPCTLNSTLMDCLLCYSGTSYNSSARTPQKTRVTCQTASSLIRCQHWAWRGRYRKRGLIYCCVFDRVYGAVAWQHVVQIRYVMKLILHHVFQDPVTSPWNLFPDSCNVCLAVLTIIRFHSTAH
jgi:hypothetical protein